MLGEFFRTGLQLTQVIGLACLLWGVLLLVAALAGGRGGPFDLIKGIALALLGVWLAGIGQSLGP